MTPGIFLAIAVAGGLGAVARYVFDTIAGHWAAKFQLRQGSDLEFPFGIAVINLVGSFLLGLLVGLSLAGTVDSQWVLIIGTGFLGGFTTFSTASVDTVRMVFIGHHRRALTNSIGILIGAIVLAGIGLWLGSGVAG